MPKVGVEVKPGVRIDDAYLYVIEEVDKSGKLFYLVQYDCCGRTGLLTRGGIVNRIREGSELCFVCNAKRAHRGARPRREKKSTRVVKVEQYGVVSPTWDPPNLVKHQKFIGR